MTTFASDPTFRALSPGGILSHEEILELLRSGTIDLETAFRLQNERIETEIGADVGAESQRFQQRLAANQIEFPDQAIQQLDQALADVGPLLSDIAREREQRNQALQTRPEPQVEGFAAPSLPPPAPSLTGLLAEGGDPRAIQRLEEQAVEAESGRLSPVPRGFDDLLAQQIPDAAIEAVKLDNIRQILENERLLGEMGQVQPQASVSPLLANIPSTMLGQSGTPGVAPGARVPLTPELAVAREQQLLNMSAEEVMAERARTAQELEDFRVRQAREAVGGPLAELTAGLIDPIPEALGLGRPVESTLERAAGVQPGQLRTPAEEITTTQERQLAELPHAIGELIQLAIPGAAGVKIARGLGAGRIGTSIGAFEGFLAPEIIQDLREGKPVEGLTTAIEGVVLGGVFGLGGIGIEGLNNVINKARARKAGHAILDEVQATVNRTRDALVAEQEVFAGLKRLRQTEEGAKIADEVLAGVMEERAARAAAQNIRAIEGARADQVAREAAVEAIPERGIAAPAREEALTEAIGRVQPQAPPRPLQGAGRTPITEPVPPVAPEVGAGATADQAFLNKVAETRTKLLGSNVLEQNKMVRGMDRDVAQELESQFAAEGSNNRLVRILRKKLEVGGEPRPTQIQRTPSVQPQEVTGAGAPPSGGPVPQARAIGEVAIPDITETTVAGRPKPTQEAAAAAKVRPPQAGGVNVAELARQAEATGTKGARTPEEEAVEGAVRMALGGGAGVPGGAAFAGGGQVDFAVGAAREALKRASQRAGATRAAITTVQDIKRVFDLYGTQIDDAIARRGGPVGKVLGRMGRRMNEENRRFQAEMSEIAEEARKTITARGHRLLSKKQRAVQKARKDLQKYEAGEAEPDALYSRNRLLTEDLKRTPATPEEATTIALERRWLRKSGVFAEEAGVQRQMTSGEIQQFRRAQKENRLPRIGTPDLYRIVQKDGVEMERLAEIIAKENGWPESQKAAEILKELWGPKSTRVVGMFEIQRAIPKMPDAINLKGKVVQLLETDPLRLMTTGTETLGARLGFIKVMGQEAAEVAPVEVGGAGKQISKAARFRKRYEMAGGRPEDYDAWIKVHNNRPIALWLESEFSNPGLLHKTFVDIANPIYQAAALSSSAIVNIPETIGALRTQVGTRRLIQSIIKAARHPIQGREELIRIAAINRAFMDWHLRANYKTHDLGRLIREGALKTTLVSFANEANEMIAATGGKLMAEEILALGRMGKKISRSDIQAMEILRLPKRLIDRVAQGKIPRKSQEETRFIREMSARTTGFTQGSGTMTRAERSSLANRPLFRFLVDFQTYSQTKTNRMGSLGRNFAKHAAAGDAANATIALHKIASEITGTAAAGAAATWLASIAYGRIADFGDGGLDSFLQQLMQGSIPAPLRSIQFFDPQEQPLVNVAGVLPKGRLVVNLTNAIADRQRFRHVDREFGDTLLEVVKASTAISKTAGLYLTLTSQQDPAVIHASRKYWKWRRDNNAMRGGGRDKSALDRRYRNARSRLERAITNGQQDKALELLEEALAIGIEKEAEKARGKLQKPLPPKGRVLDSQETIIKSLRAKKLLVPDDGMTKKQLEQMLKDLPPDVLHWLEVHDDLIEEWIKKTAKAKGFSKARQAALRRAG